MPTGQGPVSVSLKKVRECDGVSGRLPVLPVRRLSIWNGKNRLLPREFSAISQPFYRKSLQY